MATFNDCIAVLQASAGDTITEAQAKQIINDIVDFAKKKKSALNTDDLAGLVLSKIKQDAKDGLLAAVVEKRSQLINIKVAKDIDNYIKGFKNPALAIKAYMGGTVKLHKGGRLSVDAKGKSLANKYLGRFISDLEKAGVLDIFNSGIIDREIAREMWEIKPHGNPGVTKSKEARAIAEIVHKWQDVSINRQNRAGAFIKKLPGYIVRQTHSMSKIRRAGFEHWKKTILPRLDHEATFGTHDVDKFLKGAYDGLATGFHLSAKGGGESNFVFGFKGPANVAKKVSQERLLQFKSADDWFDYNNEFGSAALREGVIFGLEHAARNTALMEAFGTNPLAMLDRVLRKQKALNREVPKVVDDLNSKTIQNLFKEIEGTSRIPSNITGAHIGSGIRIVQNMAKLGAATVSAITDIPFQVAELRYQGLPVFKSYANAFASVLRGRGNTEQKQIARLIGVGFDGVTGEIMSRFSSIDHTPGTMAKMQQRFFKLNTMTWWNDSHRTGVALMMSNHLAGMKQLPFEKLDADTQRIFGLYNITEKDWNVIRSQGVQKLNGNSYVTPDLIQNLSDDFIANNVLGISKSVPITKVSQLPEGGVFIHPETGQVLRPASIGEFADTSFIDKVVEDFENIGTPLTKTGENMLIEHSQKMNKLVEHSADYTPAQKRKMLTYRDELENKLSTYFVDRADFAIPMPGAAERAMMNRGTSPGTVLGEAVRFIAQFKSFPITAIHKTMGREVYGKGANSLSESLLRGKGDIQGLAHLIVSSTLFGYMALVAKDTLKGKTPRDFSDPKTITAAMAQGGGLGIYGDFLFGEYSRFGGGFLSTLMGPTIGQVGDISTMWAKLRNGDNVATDIFRTGMNNTPFVNLYYTRFALDYLILYQIQELMHPGYLRRLEGRLKKERNQEFYLPPSKVIPRGGGSHPFEAVL